MNEQVFLPFPQPVAMPNFFPFRCQICEAPAAHSNYGAKTCAACKMFFKRHVERNQVNRKWRNVDEKMSFVLFSVGFSLWFDRSMSNKHFHSTNLFSLSFGQMLFRRDESRVNSVGFQEKQSRSCWTEKFVGRSSNNDSTSRKKNSFRRMRKSFCVSVKHSQFAPVGSFRLKQKSMGTSVKSDSLLRREQRNFSDAKLHKRTTEFTVENAFSWRFGRSLFDKFVFRDATSLREKSWFPHVESTRSIDSFAEKNEIYQRFKFNVRRSTFSTFTISGFLPNDGTSLRLESRGHRTEYSWTSRHRRVFAQTGHGVGLILNVRLHSFRVRTSWAVRRSETNLRHSQSLHRTDLEIFGLHLRTRESGSFLHATDSMFV